MTNTALLFDPYLDTLGGGERYTLTVADCLSQMGWQVLLAWNDPGTLQKARQRFSLKLEGVLVDSEYFNLFTSKSDLPTRYKSLKDLNLVFVVSDGSVPVLFGKKTILHYQVPFTKTNRFPLLDRLKLLSVNHIVVNSLFTKNVIDKTLFTNKSVVLYPPVDVESFQSRIKKENLILNVGRFASPSHSKRQDILIEAFKQLIDTGLAGWRLILAGGQMGEASILDDLKHKTKGYPIDFVVNPPFDKLCELYAKSTFYWHAAGFEVDESLNPESVEHFGITTVEAMAAGCVPLVVNKGGQKEIVTSKEGILWDTTKQLVDQTTYLIKQKRKLSKLAANAQAKANLFSVDNFYENLKKLLA